MLRSSTHHRSARTRRSRNRANAVVSSPVPADRDLPRGAARRIGMAARTMRFRARSSSPRASMSRREPVRKAIDVLAADNLLVQPPGEGHVRRDPYRREATTMFRFLRIRRNDEPGRVSRQPADRRAPGPGELGGAQSARAQGGRSGDRAAAGAGVWWRASQCWTKSWCPPRCSSGPRPARVAAYRGSMYSLF